MIFGVQNADHFESLDDVDYFYGLGQRVSQLTYNARNLIGTGSTEPDRRRPVGLGASRSSERMNDVGMAVDVSHCERPHLARRLRGLEEARPGHALERPRARGRPRPLQAERGDRRGRKGPAASSASPACGCSSRPTSPPPVEHFLDHFDYLTKRIGAEHVGIGSDIDLYGYDDMPEEDMKRLRAAYTKGKYHFREQIDIPEVAHPQRVFDLTEGLIRRGYTDPDIRGILGGNFRRVLEEIWG